MRRFVPMLLLCFLSGCHGCGGGGGHIAGASAVHVAGHGAVVPAPRASGANLNLSVSATLMPVSAELPEEKPAAILGPPAPVRCN